LPDLSVLVGSVSQMRSQNAAIETYALRRSFGDFDAVDGVDLNISSGEIYGFLGPNGAGKSTTVKVLCTLLAPTGGQAIVAGYDVATSPTQVRLNIGAALQDAAIDPKLTGREILWLQGRYYGLHRHEIDERVDDVLRLVDIGDAIDRRAGTYSGGMRRRLDLAAALVHNPHVLFLDEPTTGLDPVSRLRVWDEVRRLNAELGMTIFLTTQYLEEADELAHRVSIINEGRIVAEGTPEALKRNLGNDVITARIDTDGQGADQLEIARRSVEGLTGVDSAHVRADAVTISTADGAATISPVAVALNACGVRVVDLSLRTPTLDDVFFEITGAHIRGDEE
jgi:ABC-2 type transport system ATP-binding protein